MRRTKIVATIGPSSTDTRMLRRMIEAGMDVARLNFSHGTQSDHERNFRTLRRLADKLGSNWHHGLIRPPGALPEEEFLKRCIRCGQCMRICPTNVIQPAGIEAGVENLWTPALNNRIGTSGCQLNCVACGQVCATAAIRPITLSEKLGIDEFAHTGPIKLGTAFVDRNRCLPWAMDKPCIVCQENCPISPKAIFTRENFSTIRGGVLSVKEADTLKIEFEGVPLQPGRFATGDYYCMVTTGGNGNRRRIVNNTANTAIIASSTPWVTPPARGSSVHIQVRLQLPFVDPKLCNGCGICIRPGHCDAVIVTDGLAIIHAETCTGCGICVAICPRKALEWDTSPGIPTGHRE